jgi:hypothetical protein
MESQRKELTDSFTEAWNSTGHAIGAIICLLLTLLVAFLESLTYLIRGVRGWILAGAKFPDWVLPELRPRSHRSGEETKVGSAGVPIRPSRD